MDRPIIPASPAMRAASAQALADARELLPWAGPLQGFVHRTMLPALVEGPFASAVQRAHAAFGAAPSMSLAFYRAAYHQGEIRPPDLGQSLEEAWRASGLAGERGTIAGMPPEQAARRAVVALAEEVPSRRLYRQAARRDGWSAGAAERLWQALAGRSLLPAPAPAGIRGALRAALPAPLVEAGEQTLLELAAGFVDQLVARWPMPGHQEPFFAAVLRLTAGGPCPLFAGLGRELARPLWGQRAEQALPALLAALVDDPVLAGPYLCDALWRRRGWSSMAAYLEVRPQALARRRALTLGDWAAAALWTELVTARRAGTVAMPVGASLAQPSAAGDDGAEPAAAAHLCRRLGLDAEQVEALGGDSLRALRGLLAWLTPLRAADILHQAYEASAYRPPLACLAGVRLPAAQGGAGPAPQVQAIFCIDDRAFALRQHLEASWPEVETLATPGFFEVDCCVQAGAEAAAVQSCPASLEPRHVLKEMPPEGNARGEGTLLLQRPEGAGGRADDGLLVGYTPDEMAERVARLLRTCGLGDRLADLVVLVGHGASSRNSPYFAAYGCGACAGRPGAVNARAAAAMANLPAVRALLAARQLAVPETTRFVAAYHDTTCDQLAMVDMGALPEAWRQRAAQFQGAMAQALGRHARRRLRRLGPPARTLADGRRALGEAARRAAALFEPRREGGHQGNFITVIGPWALASKLPADSQAFAQSYQPDGDPDGAVLAAVLAAVVPVCAGINLDYLFSRFDPEIWGAGDKRSHNITAALAVVDGIHGDLRLGLPRQSVEHHPPLREVFVVAQRAAVVEAVLAGHPRVRAWFAGGWAHLVAWEPPGGRMMRYLPTGGWREVAAC